MIKVGVIRGGTDGGYNASLASGGYILSRLRNEDLSGTYQPIDIFIDQSGFWHIGGIPVLLSTVAEKVDVVINTLHGDTNTIGGVQRFLEQHNIPYTGSSSETCSVISDRASIKEELSKFGINTPRHILYSAYLEDLDGGSYGDFAFDKARDVLNRLPPPWVVKPLTRESSMGIFVCKTVKELVNAFTVGAQEKVSILVEEMIEGKHANMSVINNFRDQDIYPLLCSGNFTPNEKRDVEELAKLVHEKLNLRHYSQSDLIVTPNRGIYVVEVNAFPELHKDATIHKHLEDIGSKTSDFIEHIIGLARS